MVIRQDCMTWLMQKCCTIYVCVSYIYIYFYKCHFCSFDFFLWGAVVKGKSYLFFLFLFVWGVVEKEYIFTYIHVVLQKPSLFVQFLFSWGVVVKGIAGMQHNITAIFINVCLYDFFSWFTHAYKNIHMRSTYTIYILKKGFLKLLWAVFIR